MIEQKKNTNINPKLLHLYAIAWFIEVKAE